MGDFAWRSVFVLAVLTANVYAASNKGPNCDNITEPHVTIDWDLIEPSCSQQGNPPAASGGSGGDNVDKTDCKGSNNFKAVHPCQNETIPYPTKLPNYGNHRDNWAKYGEYSFLPRQRYLHNLEHGTIVLLYHPCAPSDLVDQFRKKLTGCYAKHIVTKATKDDLTLDRPFALLEWGCTWKFKTYVESDVLAFIDKHIQEKAAPEFNMPKNGQYTWFQKKVAAANGADGTFDANIKSC